MLYTLASILGIEDEERKSNKKIYTLLEKVRYVSVPSKNIGFLHLSSIGRY
jgi:hypothetical protein